MWSPRTDACCLQDEDMDYIYDQLVQDYGAVSYEAFINLLVCSLIQSNGVACSLFITGGYH